MTDIRELSEKYAAEVDLLTAAVASLRAENARLQREVSAAHAAISSTQMWMDTQDDLAALRAERDAAHAAGVREAVDSIAAVMGLDDIRALFPPDETPER